MYLFLLFFFSGLQCSEKNIEFFQKQIDQLSVFVQEKNEEIGSVHLAIENLELQKIEEGKQRIEKNKEIRFKTYEYLFFNGNCRLDEAMNCDLFPYCPHAKENAYQKTNYFLAFLEQNSNCLICGNISKSLTNLNQHILNNLVLCEHEEEQKEDITVKKEFLKNLFSININDFKCENLFDIDLKFFMSLNQVSKSLITNVPVFSSFYLLCYLGNKDQAIADEMAEYFTCRSLSALFDKVLFDRAYFFNEVRKTIARWNSMEKPLKQQKKETDPFIMFQNQIAQLNEEIKKAQDEINECENCIKQIQEKEQQEPWEEIDKKQKEIEEIIKEFTLEEASQQEELIKRNQKIDLYKRLIFGETFENLDEDSVLNFEFQLPRCFHHNIDQLCDKCRTINRVLKICNQDILKFSILNEKNSDDKELIKTIFFNNWSREFLFPDVSHQNFFITEEQINWLDNEKKKQLIPILALSSIVSLVHVSNNKETEQYILNNEPAKIWRRVLFHKDDLIREIEASKSVLTKVVDKVVKPAIYKTKNIAKDTSRNNKKTLIAIVASLVIIFAFLNKNKIQNKLKNYRNYLASLLS